MWRLPLEGSRLHEDAADNVVYDWDYGNKAETDAAFASAAHTTKLEIADNRVIANAMEPRGCYAEMEGDRLHVCINGQGVWGARDEIAEKLGLEKSDLRVTNPDVGGGFGMKAFMYPEYFAVADATRRLNMPIRFIQTDLQLKVLTGVYDVQTVHYTQLGVYTNTTQIDAYRGAGRPEAIYTIERLMDYSARQLGQDPVEFRRKSFIGKDQFPYLSVTGETYDVGDFERVLSRAEKEADLAGFAARKAAAAKDGKLLGIGLSYYIESILGDQTETTKIEFADDGMINLYVGTQSNGQGHETVFAQILNERAGIPFEKIRMVQGDSDLIAKGGGTGGSRSVTMQGNSINVTADLMIEKFKPLAEEDLD